MHSTSVSLLCINEVASEAWNVKRSHCGPSTRSGRSRRGVASDSSSTRRVEGAYWKKLTALISRMEATAKPIDKSEYSRNRNPRPL